MSQPKHFPVRRKKSDAASSDAPQSSAQVRTGTRSSGAKKSDYHRGDAPQVPDAPRRERRALSHVGGEVLIDGGHEEDHQTLAHALDVTADEDEVMRDVHGFHSYPARMHPLTARRLIEGYTQPGDRVLDPFCGSGTVVVEARALGRKALGSDLNPLAVELAWLKSRGGTRKEAESLLLTAERIAEVAEERRIGKADPYRRYESEERERYPIHILLELDSLANGVNLLPATEMQRALRLVISSILTKVSHSEGDTTRQKAPRRLPSGFAIRLFVDKAKELARRLDAYGARIADRSPRAFVTCADARQLEKIESDSVDLIVTSPPYPGVYDYLDHHLHRLGWLGLRSSRLGEGEIGARRAYRRLRFDQAVDLFREEFGRSLYEMRRVLARDGRAVMIIADSVIDGRAFRCKEAIQAVSEKAGVEIVCAASQERPLFLYGADRAFSDGPRMEHVLVIRPVQRARKAPEPRDPDDRPIRDRSADRNQDDRPRGPRRF